MQLTLGYERNSKNGRVGRATIGRPMAAAAADAAPATIPEDVHVLARELCSTVQGIMMLTAGLMNESTVPVRITLTKAPREGAADAGRENPVMMQINTDDRRENQEALLALQLRTLTSMKQAMQMGGTPVLERWRREHAAAEAEAAKLAREANERDATLARAGRGSGRGRGRGRGRGAAAVRATEAAPAETTPAVEELET